MARYRPTAMSRNGMVASSHPMATLAGAKVLMKGGNAFDAAVATNAALNVTQPHLCGIGGDAFFLLFDSRTGGVEFLNASGRASRNASIDLFRERKCSEIPSRGVLAAINVPGCVDGWQEVMKRHGSLEMPDLLEDAIALADEGFPVSHHLSDSIASASQVLSGSKEWKRIFTRDGKPPRPGEILTQTDLAWTLKHIARGGRAEFYEGAVAKKIAESMKLHSGLLDEEDFAKHTSEWGDPICTKYRDYLIYETAQNSQAITALLAFNLLSHFDVKSMGLESLEYNALMIESAEIAYQYRSQHITDPAEMNITASELLAPSVAERDAEKLKEKKRFAPNATLDFARTAGKKKVKEDGDTTYFCIVDKDQNCVSCIQSLYFGFGSGFIPEGTGIVLQNRGSYFSLNPSHHNALKPRKRTFHTLCASLSMKGGNPYLVFGSMGGDVQPQIHQQVISSVLDFDTDIQQAIENPRWARPGTIYEKLDTIHIEARYPPSIVEGLRALGFKTKTEEDLWPITGHAQGITIDQNTGVSCGGADPRGDGLAIGI